MNLNSRHLKGMFANFMSLTFVLCSFLINSPIKANPTGLGTPAVTVSGQVTANEDGMPLPGVNIREKGTSNGTITDINGQYQITVADNAMLVFSFIGYTTIEENVGNRTTIDIQMAIDAMQLQEVVVIGYGTQQLSEVSTAISHITPDDFVAGSVRNVGELIRGKVAGLSITTSSGSPNAQTEIQLRGITSIFGSSTPLILIDGYPGTLESISPNDIASIDILKDASAAAIYGTRGKNGVILVTTKKVEKIQGQVPISIEYSGYVATDQISKKANFNTAEDVRRLISEGHIDPSFDEGYNTDWVDEITQAPVSYFHNLSLRGGSQKTNYTANLSYRDQEGLIQFSKRQEFIGRLDINHSIRDNLMANINVLNGLNSRGNRIYGENEGGSDNAGSTLDGFEGIWRQTVIRNPTDRVTDDDGNWIERSIAQYSNPVSRLFEETADDEANYTWITGALTYFPIENLKVNLSGSRHSYNRTYGSYLTKQHFNTVARGENGTAAIAENHTVENFLDFTMDYSTSFDDHRISALVGYSYLDETNFGTSIRNYDFPSDNFDYHQIQLGRALGENRTNSGASTYKNDETLIGFFGRLAYGFSNRYNILASLRYEGSSKFGDNNKWGVFPAISAGWTISNEAFMANSETISSLKLRAGYGITGSTPNASYQSLTRYRYNPSQFFFSNGVWRSILEPASNPNPDLKWERNIEMNFGLDFGLFNDKLTGSIDVYNRTVKDLLFNFPVPVPPNLVGTTLANAAEISNKGVEIGLNFSPINQSDFEWNTNMNFSRNINKLVSLSNDTYDTQNPWFNSGYTGAPIQEDTHRSTVGEAIGSFWGYVTVDVDADGEFIIENDSGERKRISDNVADDKRIMGNGHPAVFAAWNNYFRHKNFDFSVTMRGAFDFQILNFQRMYYENPNTAFNKLKTAYDLVYDKEVLSSSLFITSYYVEEGDYWKIDNVTLGYSFPSASDSFFKSLRIYGSVSNLAVLTGYSGIDPEVSRAPLTPGNDARDEFPSLRTFTAGVDIKF